MRSSLLLALFALTACMPPVTTTPSTALDVGSAQNGALTAKLLSPSKLETGLSTLWVELTSNGQPVTDAMLHVHPMLAMSTGHQSCPMVGEPEHLGSGRYETQLVFPEASTDSLAWSVGVHVMRGEAEQMLTFDGVSVAASNRVRTFAVGDEQWVASLNFEGGAHVGTNTARVTLHRSTEPMTWVAVDDASLEMMVMMTAHGHGSAGNVAPTSTGTNGVYEGTVNFSMMGAWETTFTITRAGATLATVSFDTSL